MRRVHSVVLVAAALLPAACGGAPPGFDTPVAAVHDALADVYFVSNCNGPLLAKDGNGYVARVAPDGSMDRHWIRGGRGGVTLDSPTGLAIAGDVLWVADVDTLRRFDRRSGAPLGELPLPGARCLWGLAAAPDGTVYCTDAGFDAALVPTGTDTLWRIPAGGGAPEVLARGVELGQPTALCALATGVFAVGWRDGAFYQVDGKGRRTDLGKAPEGRLTGLVRLPPRDGEAGVWLACGRAGNRLYRFDLGGVCVPLEHVFEDPGQCGYDAARGRVLLPLLGGNRLEMLQP